MSIANRIYSYLNILIFQGFLLFGITYLTLTEINTANLILIMLETIIFKAVAVPWFMKYIIRRNNITREAEPYLPNFISLIIVTLIIVITIILSSSIEDKFLDKTFLLSHCQICLQVYISSYPVKKLLLMLLATSLLKTGFLSYPLPLAMRCLCW
jgi:hydrogenase-4 membrane subunit HyfE